MICITIQTFLDTVVAMDGSYVPSLLSILLMHPPCKTYYILQDVVYYLVLPGYHHRIICRFVKQWAAQSLTVISPDSIQFTGNLLRVYLSVITLPLSLNKELVIAYTLLWTIRKSRNRGIHGTNTIIHCGAAEIFYKSEKFTQNVF